MTSKLFLWTASTLTVIGLSSGSWAGGHGGPIIRAGGFQAGAPHMGHALPPVSGTWHVRTGQITRFGQAGPAFGHTNTGYGAGRPFAGYGRPNAGFGHTNTAPVFARGAPAFAPGAPAFAHGNPGPGYGHTNTAFGAQSGPRILGHVQTAPNGYRAPLRVAVRYGRDGRPFGFWRNHLYSRFGAGRYAPVLAGSGSGYGGGFAPGYGGGVASGYGSGSPGYGGSSVETPLSSQYSEPPLNQGGSGSYGGAYAPQGGAYAPQGGGGPQVIVVNNNYGGAGCDCGRGRAPSPVVYRFGVGSYY